MRTMQYSALHNEKDCFKEYLIWITKNSYNLHHVIRILVFPEYSFIHSLIYKLRSVVKVFGVGATNDQFETCHSLFIEIKSL